jgi:hypothetical protein
MALTKAQGPFSQGINDGADATAITIDSSENVGIGTTSPSDKLHVYQNSVDNVVAKVENASSNHGSLLQFSQVTSGSVAAPVAYVGHGGDNTGDFMINNASATNTKFYTNSTERMRIDSNGNVGIDDETPDSNLVGGISSSGILLGRYDTTSGAPSPAGRAFYCASASNAGGYTSGSLLLGARPDANNRHIHFFTSDTERMRIDSSGSLLVAQTSGSSADTGHIFNTNGTAFHIRDGGVSLVVDRQTDDGPIALFRRDGVTIGAIKSNGSDNLVIEGTVSGHCGLQFASQFVYPRLNEADADGTVSIGQSGARFDDIYATNGTIQTSDANEKQDIEELTEAETRVAVAAKALLRKYRWKSAVKTKSHDARIHFGIIAQDLQAAFEAEGLDAGRYGMFIHTIWTDEETGEERDRMGIRYSELLAFIIAAI